MPQPGRCSAPPPSPPLCCSCPRLRERSPAQTDLAGTAPGFTARFVTAAVLIETLSLASRQGRLQEQLTLFVQPHVLVVDEVGYLAYGPDAANVLFHIVNESHQRGRPMLFTTNKPPLTAWGDVLHDHDLAEAIVDRVLENGRLVLLDGPSYRTRHLDLPADQPHDRLHQPARFSEPTCIQ